MTGQRHRSQVRPSRRTRRRHEVSGSRMTMSPNRNGQQTSRMNEAPGLGVKPTCDEESQQKRTVDESHERGAGTRRRTRLEDDSGAQHEQTHTSAGKHRQTPRRQACPTAHGDTLPQQSHRQTRQQSERENKGKERGSGGGCRKRRCQRAPTEKATRSHTGLDNKVRSPPPRDHNRQQRKKQRGTQLWKRQRAQKEANKHSPHRLPREPTRTMPPMTAPQAGGGGATQQGQKAEQQAPTSTKERPQTVRHRGEAQPRRPVEHGTNKRCRARGFPPDSDGRREHDQ